MKLASELPIQILNEPAITRQTDYDFIISCHCGNPAYLNHFLKPSNRYRILDNGAFETGESTHIDQYLDLIGQLNPDVVVLPDKPGDFEETLQQSFEFLSILKGVKPDQKVMGTIQGSSLKECQRLYQAFLAEGVRFIGIPYRTFNRKTLIDILLNISDEAEFHLLGLQNPFELREFSNYPLVVSCDTSLAVTSGIVGKYFVEFKWHKTPLNLTSSLDKKQLHAIEANLAFLKIL